MPDLNKLLSDEELEDKDFDDPVEAEVEDDEGADAPEVDDESGDEQPDESEDAPDDSGAADVAPKTVPLKALQEERRARQQLQRQLEELAARLPKAEPVDPTAGLPDPINDPQGFAKGLLDKANDTIRKERYAMSKAMVEEEGVTDEDIDAAVAAIEALPADQRPTFRNHPHPFKALMKWHEDHKTKANPGAVDIDAIRAQIKREIMAELGVGKEAPKKTPPKSAPSASGDGNARRPLKTDSPDEVVLSTKDLFGVIK